jgi:trimeric autotransporter adhesin
MTRVSSRIESLRKYFVRLAVLILVPLSTAWAATQYLYDDLGRLVLTVSSDGSAIVYQHDQNGNVVSVIQTGSSAPIIAAFSPSSGHAGSAVTISGTGFSQTAAQNTVTIGGQQAVVTASSATAITTSIPLGAHTGPITVTVGGVTATSTQNIVVYVPTIASFTPAAVAAGNSVTLTGTSLNLVPGGTSVLIGSVAATITSISNTQIVFAAPSNAAGAITVHTSYGDAISQSPLVVVPASIGAANVLSIASAQTNGSAQSLSVNQQNKYGILLFNGTAGQFVSVQVDSLTTTPSGATVTYQLFSPSGASAGSAFASGTTRTGHFAPLPATGTYLVAFNSGSSSSMQLSVRVEANAALSVGTSLSASASGIWQSKRFTFSANSGDNLGLAMTALALTPSSPNYVRVSVFQPNGSYIVTGAICYLTNTPGCPFNLPNVPATGTYTVVVDSQGASTMSFGLALSQDVTGALTAGTPQTVTLSQPGRQGLLTFTATAGQAAAVNMSSIATTPTGKSVTMIVYNPSGTAVAQTSNATQATLNLTNLVAGTYSVLLTPADAATGSIQVKLANGLTGVLPSDASTQNFSAGVPGQNGYFTFSANAGDDFGLAMTGLSFTPSSPNYVRVWVYEPNGYYILGGPYCYATNTPGCSFNLLNVPETGTYKVVVEAQGASAMSFGLTLSQDVTGALTAGTPQTVTLSQPGRQGLLTFTATAGQAAALNMSSIATTPAGKSVTMAVYNPSGNQVTSTTGTSQATLNLTNLVAGTYSVLLSLADAATGSVQVKLANGLTGVLPSDGSTQNFSAGVPGQNGYFTFSANAGDDLGLAMTGLSFTPSSPNYVRVWVYQPNGYYILGGPYCYATNTPGCSFNLLNVPVTGTYSVVVEAQGASAMSFGLTLSQDVTGALTAGTPQTVTLSQPGRQGLLTFTATAGQAATLNMSSIATTPAGKSITMIVYNPSGTAVAQTSNATQATLNLTNLVAGTYSVLLTPADAATGSMQVSVQ